MTKTQRQKVIEAVFPWVGRHRVARETAEAMDKILAGPDQRPDRTEFRRCLTCFRLMYDDGRDTCVDCSR